mmetsp:Transcript_30958/g.41075  ORF Transcript_30958/g.41075 Transcript_30958/m.41075 type:complete len:454 (-) Transcript_30958:328-1689(-)
MSSRVLSKKMTKRALATVVAVLMVRGFYVTWTHKAVRLGTEQLPDGHVPGHSTPVSGNASSSPASTGLVAQTQATATTPTRPPSTSTLVSSTTSKPASKDIVKVAKYVPAAFGMIPAPAGETATFRFGNIPVKPEDVPPKPGPGCPLQRRLHPNKPHIRVAIVITSGTFRKARRDAARATWLPTLAGESVVYKFFTDDPAFLSADERKQWEQEDAEHGDVAYAATKPGLRHTEIFLSASAWFLQRYDFDWILKLDDDMFVCVPYLMNELGRLCDPYLYWGRYHCDCQHCKTSRMDAFFTIFGRDMVDFMWERHADLLCSPFFDQVVPKWFWELVGTNKTTMFDDHRLVQLRHDWLPIVSAAFCKQYIVAHQCYEHDMMKVWDAVKTDMGQRPSFESKPVNFTCPSSLEMDPSQYIPGPWGATPVLCFNHMAWPLAYDTGKENIHYKGDQEKLT